MKRLHATILTLTLMALCAQAQLTAVNAFVKAPMSVFPLLETNTRLDMVDYFKAGMPTQSTNNLGGGSAILTLDDANLRIKLTDASTDQVFILPAAGGDSIIGLIHTVATPGHDSSLRLFDSAWESLPLAGRFTAPELTDWVTDRKHLADIEIIVPFMLTGYSYDPASATLMLTNNLEGFLSSDLYDTISPYIAKTLSFSWDGKKFRQNK